MTVYAYIRVSSDKQTCSNQHHSIEEYSKIHNIKIDKYIEETISSRKELSKRELGKLLFNSDIIKDNDTIIVTEISRLARNLYELATILQYSINKNIKVISIKENYSFENNIQSKIMAYTFGISAEIERDLISTRTKMSLNKLKDNNIKLGRPIGIRNKKLKLNKYKDKITELLNKGISQLNICKLLDISPSSMCRYLKRGEG